MFTFDRIKAALSAVKFLGLAIAAYALYSYGYNAGFAKMQAENKQATIDKLKIEIASLNKFMGDTNATVTTLIENINKANAAYSANRALVGRLQVDLSKLGAYSSSSPSSYSNDTRAAARAFYQCADLLGEGADLLAKLDRDYEITASKRASCVAQYDSVVTRFIDGRW